MHNQKRSEYKARFRHDATAAKLAAKAQQWNELTSQLLKRRESYQQRLESCNISTTNATDTTSADIGTNNDTTSPKEELKDDDFDSIVSRMLMDLPLLEKLLTVNPDPTYLWNYRRDLLLLPIVTNNNYNNMENSKDKDPSFITSFIQKEQELTATCLQKNPKAYGPWFHRKWSIRYFIQLMQKECSKEDSSTTSLKEHCETVLQTELHLCAEFLSHDERNFHCWNYRRFIVAALAFVTLEGKEEANHSVFTALDGSWNEWCFTDTQMKSDRNGVSLLSIGAQIAELSFSKSIKYLDLDSTTADTTIDSSSESRQSHEPSCKNTQYGDILTLLQSEWEFTTAKIQQNFSNGSAFHYRSKLLPMILELEAVTDKVEGDDGTDVKLWRRWDKIQEELELIRNAIYTEPDDQTSWWYYRFILAMANPINNSFYCDDSGGQDEGQEYLDEYRDMLMEEWESLQELIETEGGACKWGLIGSYMVAMALHESDSDKDKQESEWLQGANKCLSTLQELDPDRAVRYGSMLS